MIDAETPVATASRVARAVRDAVFADGALSEVVRPDRRREEATTRSALAWHPEDGVRKSRRRRTTDGAPRGTSPEMVRGVFARTEGMKTKKMRAPRRRRFDTRAHGRCARMAWRGAGHGRALALVGASGRACGRESVVGRERRARWRVRRER